MDLSDSAAKADELAPLVAAWGVELGAIIAIVLWDEKRLSSERLARAWPPASRWAAIVAFAEIALFVHFVRTRRNVAGVVLGVVAVVVVLALGELAAALAGMLFAS